MNRFAVVLVVAVCCGCGVRKSSSNSESPPATQHQDIAHWTSLSNFVSLDSEGVRGAFVVTVKDVTTVDAPTEGFDRGVYAHARIEQVIHDSEAHFYGSNPEV